MNDDKLNRYRPSPDALLNPCSDEVFKALFTNESEESRTALRCFLTAVLHKQVKDVQLRPNEPPVLDDNDKAVRFDVSCIFNDGEVADVEMQGVNKYHAFGARAEYLCARLLNSVFHKGDDWQNIPKVDELGDVPPESLHSEEKWCKFLLDADNPCKQEYVRQLAAVQGGIMEAQKTLDRISSDWVLWKQELDREVIECDRNSELHYAQEQGINQGIKQGISQGTMQANRDIALNMKKAGIPIVTIVQCTGLSEDEIAGDA